MRVLLDESLPRRLKLELAAHDVTTVPEAGWSGTANGELLLVAEPDFDVFVTMDSHLPAQQNLSELDLCVVILRAKSSVLSDLLTLADPLRSAVAGARPGKVVILKA